MDKKEATALATRKLSYGHFASGEFAIYTRCPECDEQIQRGWSALDQFRPSSAGHARALRAELVEHLTSGYCGVTYA